MSFFRSSSSTASSPPFAFQSYLFPVLPFRRRQRQRQQRKSSTSSSTSSTFSTSSTESTYLPHHTSYLRCTRCSADLISTSAIVSRGFTGRWGRAYLVSADHDNNNNNNNNNSLTITGNLPNTTTDRPVARQLVTGAHTVSDIRCALCASVLGWKYIAATEESQRYKVGKYILETKRVGVWTRWEDDGRRRRSSQEDLFSLPLSVPLPPVDATAASSSSLKLLLDASLDMSLDTALEEVEFDSQDEDECEDLFMGVWTPEAAMRRRIAKGQFAAAAAAAAVGFGSG